MAFVYRGKDRRMMQQTLRDLSAIRKRDQRALNPKKTTALSTRTPILAGALSSGAPLYTPVSPTPGSPAAMADSLIAVLVDELNDER